MARIRYAMVWERALGMQCFYPFGWAVFFGARRGKLHSHAGMEMLQRLFLQVLPPSDKETATAFLDLLSDMIDKTPCFLLSCNMEEAAAVVAYSGMTREKEKKTDGQK